MTIHHLVKRQFLNQLKRFLYNSVCVWGGIIIIIIILIDYGSWSIFSNWLSGFRTMKP